MLNLALLKQAVGEMGVGCRLGGNTKPGLHFFFVPEFLP